MKFLIALLLLSLGVWTAGVMILVPAPSYFRETVILLSVTTGGLYFFLLRVRETLPGSFVIVYLATLVIKLLALGTYIFFIVIRDTAGAVINAIFFLVAYLLFTALEVAFLYRKIGR